MSTYTNTCPRKQVVWEHTGKAHLVQGPGVQEFHTRLGIQNLVFDRSVLLSRLDLGWVSFSGEHVQKVTRPDASNDVHHVRHDVPDEAEEWEVGEG
jgi:hypothetical protein